MRLVTEVEPGEGQRALLLLINLFLLFVAYYIIKTVREPLILATGGAELKTYASAAQAVTLMALVPVYAWFARRANRLRLVVGAIIFFLVNIQVFWLCSHAGVPYLGFFYYVWVGIFGLIAIAHFWSFANDLYDRPAGERLFPMIAVGGTLGSPLGAKIAQWLFEAGVSPYVMLELAAVILFVSLLPTIAAARHAEHSGDDSLSLEPLTGRGGFSLVLSSKYLRLIALVVLLLNLVNTTGEYILAETVLSHAEATFANDSAAMESYIGAFYGDFYFYVNLLTLLIQAIVVSRVIRYVGLAGVILVLPVVALGVYGAVSVGISFVALRWAKTLENAVDYSLMSTGRAIFWLPTDVDEKYKAKQAVDTVFVRFGDVIAAGLVFVGTELIDLRTTGFALANVVFACAWIIVGWLLYREYGRLTSEQDTEISENQPTTSEITLS